ncbi:MAG: hypothetical protein LBI63_06040, partial [Candidatus Ancillula sp.]|nr:hypothetical protein [Candidatus Ancillula sp.]
MMKMTGRNLLTGSEYTGKRGVNRSGFSTSTKKRGKIGAENLVHTRTRLYTSTSTNNNSKNSSEQNMPNMRNFRNFHAKITPLIAVFALVAFSIFTFIKLPAFAQNSVQDLSENRVSCGDSASSGQDLSKTDVSRGGSAGSAEHEQDSSTQSVSSNQQAQDKQQAQDSVVTPLDTQTQDLNENRVSREHSADPGQGAQNGSVITPPTAQDNCVQTHSAGQDLESNSPITHLNTQISAQVPLRVQSTTITPKASTGVNINLSDNPETTLAGTGWTYDS